MLRNGVLPFPPAKIAAQLRKDLKARRITYRLKVYDHVVVGSKIVDWIQERSWCNDRDQAIACGTRLVEEGLLHHVSSDSSTLKVRRKQRI